VLPLKMNCRCLLTSGLKVVFLLAPCSEIEPNLSRILNRWPLTYGLFTSSSNSSMIIVFGLMSNGLYFSLLSRIWLSTTGVIKRTSVRFQEALFITLAKLILNYSSSVIGFSPLLVSGVKNSTIGDFIYSELVALLCKNLFWLSSLRACRYI